MDEAQRKARNRESVGRFVGNLAHDFNNILMVFQSGVALLEHPLDADARKRLLDGMRRAVEQGSALTRQMREFSDYRPPQAKTVEPCVLLTGMRPRLSDRLGSHMRVDLSCDEGLERVRVDPSEFELAMVNLCLNAQDAMPKGGTIRIAARKRSEGVAISVADTGHGMTEDVRERAFEPFFSTKEGDPLSGLGLSQVYAFALQSDGHARIVSEPGRGTTVEIALPRAAADAK